MDNNTKPTGCYKCGRPGHWSRDCPSSSSAATDSNTNTNTNSISINSSSSSSLKSTENKKAKKIPQSRPKLTPDLLLSDDGLGYILRHFPTAFKYGGRGREVRDLDKLIGLYSEWHSRLIPYYSFDQFVHKTEQVGATKRVKTCIRDLRDRVASGGDPTKLHQYNDEKETLNTEGMSLHQGDPSSKNHDADDIQEDMLHEVYEKATAEEPSQAMQSDMVAADILSVGSSGKDSSNQVPSNGPSCSSEFQITEEQKARMEANRLKALERAAARAQSRQAA